MTLEQALRASEILFALSALQQSIEHLKTPDRRLFICRILASLTLLPGVAPLLSLTALLATTLISLKRFNGPYNGGSDRLSILILCCLTVAHAYPPAAELALGYLALQLILSYFISGWVKIVNPDWRRGRALQDVFLFSAYPVSENLRQLAHNPRLLFAGSWAVMLFELVFPLALLTQTTLLAALIVAASFHLANACLLGLNRFFWVWLSAYPVLIWFQDRILGH